MKAQSVELQVIWSDPEGLPWDVSLRFAALEGRVQCVGFSIASVGDDRPITATLMRSVPVGRLIAEVQSEAPIDVDRLGAVPSFNALVTLAESSLSRLGPESVGLDSRPKPGRPRKYGPEHYAEVARVYLQSTVSPTSRVAEHFQVPSTRAAAWVRTARDLGLLDQAVDEGSERPPEKKRVIRDPGMVQKIRGVTDEH